LERFSLINRDRISWFIWEDNIRIVHQDNWFWQKNKILFSDNFLPAWNSMIGMIGDAWWLRRILAIDFECAFRRHSNFTLENIPLEMESNVLAPSTNHNFVTTKQTNLKLMKLKQTNLKFIEHHTQSNLKIRSGIG